MTEPEETVVQIPVINAEAIAAEARNLLDAGKLVALIIPLDPALDADQIRAAVDGIAEIDGVAAIGLTVGGDDGGDDGLSPSAL